MVLNIKKFCWAIPLSTAYPRINYSQPEGIPWNLKCNHSLQFTEKPGKILFSVILLFRDNWGTTDGHEIYVKWIFNSD